jgi:DNA gyrase subunit B
MAPPKKVAVVVEEPAKRGRGRPPKVQTADAVKAKPEVKEVAKAPAKATEKKKTTKASETKEVDKEYSGKNIKELPYPENVRTRPEMYLGPTNEKGQLTCLREIVNNSVDEYLAGHADEITIVRYSIKSFSVIDNGRGVPFDIHESKKNTLEVIFGKLHAGRNFEEKTVYSTGLNGVGASCVNAVSNSFVVWSRRNKDYGVISFKKGIKSSLVVKDDANASTTLVKTKTGTAVTFDLDETIFSEQLTTETIRDYIRQVSFVCNGLKIKFVDQINGCKEEIFFNTANGLSEMIKYNTSLQEKCKLIFAPVFYSELIDKTKVEIAFTYGTAGTNEVIDSFCNTIRTSLGGSHVTGFKRSLSQNLSKYMKENSMTKNITLDPEDFKPGLNAIVSVYSFNPKYDSQTKQGLDMNDVQGIVLRACNNALKDWMASNPKIMKILADLFVLNAKGRLAQKRALENIKKENGTFLSSLNDITKFSDCIEHGPHCELFIVEGDSAKGPCEQGRNNFNQAIYALKGKPMNVCINSDNKINNNDEINDLKSILKCTGEEITDLEKVPFGKLIILTDADIDGSHIATLTMTFSNKYFRRLIEAGMLFIAVAPLYRATRAGKAPIYLKDEIVLNKFYADELSNSFKFLNNDKEITSKVKATYISRLRSYTKNLEDVAKKYSINPHHFEITFISCLDTAETTWDFSEKLAIDLDENSLLSVNGFVTLDKEEFFVSLNKVNLQAFYAECEVLFEEFMGVYSMAIELTYKDKPFESNSFFDMFRQMEKISQSYSITRFKGLGEANPEELAATTLLPINRTLIKLMPSDLDEDSIFRLMSKDSIPKKEFIEKLFQRKLDMEAIDI